MTDKDARLARRRDEKTEAIAAAAMRTLVAEGLEALTLQRVARELGLVTTALYRYFDSKDALLAALQRRAIGDVHARLVGARAGWDAALARRAPAVRALARLIALGRFYRGLPATAPETFHLIAVLLGDPRRLISDQAAQASVPLLGALLGDALGLVEEAQGAGGLAAGDPRLPTLSLWACVHGLNLLDKLARLAPEAPPRERITDAAVGALLRGFGAPEAALRGALRIVATLEAPGARGER